MRCIARRGAASGPAVSGRLGGGPAVAGRCPGRRGGGPEQWLRLVEGVQTMLSLRGKVGGVAKHPEISTRSSQPPTPREAEARIC